MKLKIKKNIWTISQNIYKCTVGLIVVLFALTLSSILYFTAFWNPTTERLQVSVMNSDSGFFVEGNEINLGKFIFETMSNIKDSHGRKIYDISLNKETNQTKLLSEVENERFWAGFFNFFFKFFY